MTRRGEHPEHPEQEPVWQPVSQVGVLLAHVEEQLAGTREMHRMLAAGRPPRPGAVPEHMLDNDTVGRTLAVYGRMATDYRELFAEQARRWSHQPGLPAGTRERVDVFAARVAEHRSALDGLLALARELRGHTIEAVMARDDAELGVEYLLDQLRGPHPER